MGSPGSRRSSSLASTCCTFAAIARTARPAPSATGAGLQGPIGCAALHGARTCTRCGDVLDSSRRVMTASLQSLPLQRCAAQGRQPATHRPAGRQGLRRGPGPLSGAEPSRVPACGEPCFSCSGAPACCIPRCTLDDVIGHLDTQGLSEAAAVQAMTLLVLFIAAAGAGGDRAAAERDDCQRDGHRRG